jgi:hypothetical protein
LPLQVDVNEGWTFEEAIEALPQLAALHVDHCEQPLRAHDPGGSGSRSSPLCPSTWRPPRIRIARLPIHACAREAHPGRTDATLGQIQRIAQRLLALALGMLINALTGRPL